MLASPAPEVQGSLVPYRSGARAEIERDGRDILVNIGDQLSDPKGGNANRKSCCRTRCTRSTSRSARSGREAREVTEPAPDPTLELEPSRICACLELAEPNVVWIAEQLTDH